MRVRFICKFGKHQPGDRGTLPDSDAIELIDKGMAERVTDETKGMDAPPANKMVTRRKARRKGVARGQ